MFTLPETLYALRGNHILSLPHPKTTTYSLHSFSYLAAKLWNSLPDTYRTSVSFHDFKRSIRQYEPPNNFNVYIIIVYKFVILEILIN